MRYAISSTRVSDNALDAGKPNPAMQSIRCGDVWFHMLDESHLESAADTARSANGSWQTLSDRTAPERLHAVVQQGRLFQQAHPDVPVLLDKGRYLVVDLDPRDAEKWDREAGHCFAVRPLSETGDLFEARRAPATRGAELAWVRDLVDLVRRDSYEEDLKKLVAFPTRFSTSSHFVSAADVVQLQLDQMGFQTLRQPISVNGKPSANVIAEKLGSGPSSRGTVIIGAHLDSINISGGPTAPAPGADDDGSGSAGVLTIARCLQNHTSTHDLRLILFGGEEQGLFGSQQYVASLSVAQRQRIRAVVHMDMIGARNTPQPTVLLEGASLSQSIIEGLADAAATYSSLSVQTSLNPFNSDHVSFLDADIPAVLTIEGTDDANSHVHSEHDTLADIDFDLALDIVRMNVAFAAQCLE